jgi:hypothetical protein
MAVRGAEEKSKVFNDIKELFRGSFWETEGKILRIPVNGIELKVQITAAKDNLKGHEEVPADLSELTLDELDSLMEYLKENGNWVL